MLSRSPLLVPALMRGSPAPNRDHIVRHFGVQHFGSAPLDPVALPSNCRFVFLCFTNRCGSAYLGDLLQSTGVFAQAGESLNAGEVLSESEAHGLHSFREYFAHIVRRDAKDGIYIVKAQPEQLLLLTQCGILDEIADRTDFLLLRRADLLAQAISRAIAEQNDAWAWNAPRKRADSELQFAARQLTGHIGYVTFQNRCFELFFGINGITPITLEYERLVHSPQAELDVLAARLGLPPLRIAPDMLRYRQQAGALNDDWRARFLQEAAIGDETAGLPGETPRPKPAPNPPVAAEVVVHIHRVGDIAGPMSDWIGTPTSGAWIEGFSVLPHRGLAPEDIEYQGIQDLENPWPWEHGGRFCGTRALGLPLRGFRVRLRNDAASRYRCWYTATFVDGSTAGPMPAGELCRSGTLAPLEAFGLSFVPLAA